MNDLCHPENAESLLEKAGIKLTSNRLLVVRTLMHSDRPLSLIEIETQLETVERSSVLRVLNTLLDKDVIHALEDGRGVTKYEICHGENHCSVSDMHAHFYCESCGLTYCFEEVSVPLIPLPKGFAIRSVNYMLKGLCPECGLKENVDGSHHQPQ